MDRCIKTGIGGLNDCELFSGESLVVVDAFKSLIPDLQRFNPWISDRWRWRWSIHLINTVNVTVVVTVVESGSSEERCLKLAVLLVRGVVLLAAELWGSKDSGGQVLGLNVLDAVITAGADGHVRGIGSDGGGLSIEAEHWQK